jgi:hypothetical protein
LIYRLRKSGSPQPWLGPLEIEEAPPCRHGIAGMLLTLPASGGEKCIKTALTQSIFVYAADIDHRKPS